MPTLAVVTALTDAVEAPVVLTLDQCPELRLTRRCADLPELLALAATGAAEVVVVSADLRGIDRSAIAELRDCGALVLGVVPAGDEAAERTLLQMGAGAVLAPTAGVADVTAALARARGGTATGPVPPVPVPGLPDAGPELSGATDAGGDELGLVAETWSASGQEGQVVTVWGPAGAPGRSTVALNVAFELAALGDEVVLVDLDTYAGSLAQMLALLDEVPGVAAAVRASDAGTLDLVALARVAPLVAPRLRILTGLPRPDRWPELREAPLRDVVALCRRLAQHVVIDAGFCLEEDEVLSYDTRAPRRNVATVVALEAADVVLAVGKADPVGLQRLVRGLSDLRDRSLPSPSVVVTQVRGTAVGSPPGERVAEALERFAGVADPVLVPDDRPALDRALLDGRALLDVARTSPARLALADLARRVSGRAPEPSRVRRARGNQVTGGRRRRT